LSLKGIIDGIVQKAQDPSVPFVDVVFEQQEITRPPERIRALIQYLIPRDALFATFLLKAKYIKGHPGVNTAAVNVIKGRINFYYNENFINQFPPNQLMFIVAHEFYHIARMHLDRAARRKMNSNLYNIAADEIINHDIISQLGALAGMKLEMPTIDGRPIGLEIDKRYAKSHPDPKLWTTESLYRFLEKKGQSKGKPKPPKKKDLMAPGRIVRVGKGEDYGVIKKVNKDGTYEVDPLTKEEVEKRLKAS